MGAHATLKRLTNFALYTAWSYALLVAFLVLIGLPIVVGYSGYKLYTQHQQEKAWVDEAKQEYAQFLSDGLNKTGQEKYGKHEVTVSDGTTYVLEVTEEGTKILEEIPPNVDRAAWKWIAEHAQRREVDKKREEAWVKYQALTESEKKRQIGEGVIVANPQTGEERILKNNKWVPYKPSMEGDNE